jgi:hypothetical protein
VVLPRPDLFGNIEKGGRHGIVVVDDPYPAAALPYEETAFVVEGKPHSFIPRIAVWSREFCLDEALGWLGVAESGTTEGNESHDQELATRKVHCPPGI